MAPVGLSLAEAENQRASKRPRISGLKVTHCAKAIKKIRECEYNTLKLRSRYLFASGPWATPTSKPFDLPLIVPP